MKQYTVYFNEPVCHKYLGVKFNQELKEWEHDVECEEVNDTFTFDSLATANSSKPILTSTKARASQRLGLTEIGKTLVK